MTPYSELPDNELREAVARKLGWKMACNGWLGQWWSVPGCDHWCSDVPDFPNSLDACEPVKKWLWEHGVTEIVTREFPDCIVLVLFGPQTPVHASVVVEEYPHALPRALCIAFMEVKE